MTIQFNTTKRLDTILLNPELYPELYSRHLETEQKKLDMQSIMAKATKTTEAELINQEQQ